MAYWGMVLARGPYINMDGDPTFDLKGACAAVKQGLKLTNVPAHERAYVDAAVRWCPGYKPPAYSEARLRLTSLVHWAPVRGNAGPPCLRRAARLVLPAARTARRGAVTFRLGEARV